MALFRFGVVYPRLSSQLALGSRGQKFALLEKCNDRLAAAKTERVCRPLNPGNDLFMPVLNFFFTDIALTYEHRPKTGLLMPSSQLFPTYRYEPRAFQVGLHGGAVVRHRLYLLRDGPEILSEPRPV